VRGQAGRQRELVADQVLIPINIGPLAANLALMQTRGRLTRARDSRDDESQPQDAENGPDQGQGGCQQPKIGMIHCPLQEMMF